MAKNTSVIPDLRIPSSFQAGRHPTSSCLAFPVGRPGFDLTTTRSSFNV